jgi:hypothetical protein
MTSKSQVKRLATQIAGKTVRELPAKLKPSQIDWSVISFMVRPDLYCAICHALGASWAASTKGPNYKLVPLCFGCGEAKDAS